jgi:HK97 family phage major capsid protein
MSSPTDQILAGYVTEIEERQAFIDGLIKATQDKGEDLDDGKLELITRARDRISKLNDQMKPLEESRRIAGDSKQRIEQLAAFMDGRERAPKDVQYRSAGQYTIDMWRAGLGNTDARERLELFNRAAAHQTTGDNPGLLPAQILGPVVDFVDNARPLINALGPRQLPSGSWSRPVITQHSQIAAQSAEKTELASRKMTIGKLPVTAVTYGGYVNVSRQDIDWTQPQVMDIVINDLAGQYAIVTESAAGAAFSAAATAGTDLPATPTSGDVAGALWAAAGAVYTATGGAGGLIAAAAPDMLSLLGPLFAPVNPQNAQSTGFSAGQFGQGAMGAVSGIQVVVSAGIPAGQILVASSAAAEIYEDRIGALQVVEPSVLGVQVAYAGYFAPLVVAGPGIIKIVK